MIRLAKNIKRYFSFKEFAIVVIAVAVSISVGVVFFLNMKKDVAINYDGKTLVVKTMKTTVKEVLEQNGITVSPDDFVSISLDKKLQKIGKNRIEIKKAMPVNVFIDGTKMKVMTYRNTVQEALVNSRVKLTGLDRLDGLKPGDKIVKDMNIKVIRVKEELLSEKTPVEFNVISRQNDHLDKGKQQVVKQGKEGIREKIFKVIFEDGKQVLKQMKSDNIIAAPINKIIEFGTVLNFRTSRGDIVRYRKVINMRATAYTSSYADTGKSKGDVGFGITYTGVKARKGLIAVDPRVIPLGTRLYVECNGRTDYGFATAADIGGAIKGKLIDLYFEDSATVSRWGCKNVQVYILTD
jgi:uncharacterized protein YabE (DUF348 family)